LGLTFAHFIHDHDKHLSHCKSSKLGDRCDLIYSDNVEKQKRIKNIVVRGLPESEDINDTDLVKEILTVLDIETTTDSLLALVVRICSTFSTLLVKILRYSLHLSSIILSDLTASRAGF
jgi:hypothetical protein